MPLYEFRCKECDATDLRFLKMEDISSVQVCERCDGTLVRLISRPQLITSPIRLRDENRFDAGKSQEDIQEERKKEDAAWEKSWGNLSLPTEEKPEKEGPTWMDIPVEDKPADAQTMRWMLGDN